MYPHRINLRGPWHVEAERAFDLDGDGQERPRPQPLPEPTLMTMPCRWEALAPWRDFAGTVRCCRRFQWLHELTPFERLWLVFHGADYEAEVRLNGVILGGHVGAFDPFEFDITGSILPRNELEVRVTRPGLREPASRLQRFPLGSGHRGGGLWGTVALEVRRATCLQGLHINATVEDDVPRLNLAGQVAGALAPHLELRVRLGRQTLDHIPLASSGGDRAFHQQWTLPHVERWWPRELAGFGRPTRHELIVDLLDTATQLDQRVYSIGFRAVSLRGPQECLLNGHVVPFRTIELTQPIAEAESLAAQDELVGLMVPMARNHSPAARQAFDAVRGLAAGHPNIVVVQPSE